MGRLIDADAIVEYVRKYSPISDGADLLETWLEYAPTVDAVPVKHGRWIDIDSEMYTWKIRCSKCGHERSMMSTGQIYPMYCENCGTRMDWKDSDNEKTD